MWINVVKKIRYLIPLRYQWILDHGGFRRYFFNTGWLLGGQFISLLLSFFIGAWVARYFGPSNYGLVSFVVAFIGLFSFLNSLGLDSIIHRELVNHPDNQAKLLGTALRMRIYGAGLAFFVSGILAIFIGDSQLVKILIFFYSISFFFQAPLIISAFFYSQIRAKQVIKARLLAVFISSICKIILILLGGGVIWLLLIYILDSFWQSLFLIRFYRAQGLKLSTWNFDIKLSRHLWHDSWPLMLSSAAAFIYLRIDQVMIGWFMGRESVGIYAASVKLTEVFYFIPGIICGSLFSALVNARNTNKLVYRDRLRRLYFLLTILGLIISLVVTPLAGKFIDLIFGPEYLAATSILKIYIWSSIGLFLGTAISYQLTAENRTREIFVINLVAMIINIVLNIYLIPFLGLSGAAASTLLAYSFAPLWLLFRRVFNK